MPDLLWYELIYGWLWKLANMPSVGASLSLTGLLGVSLSLTDLLGAFRGCIVPLALFWDPRRALQEPWRSTRSSESHRSRVYLQGRGWGIGTGGRAAPVDVSHPRLWMIRKGCWKIVAVCYFCCIYDQSHLFPPCEKACPRSLSPEESRRANRYPRWIIYKVSLIRLPWACSLGSLSLIW